jgi:predicted nucleic acid-binding protein
LGLVDDIADGSVITIDTNTLIYYVEEHPLYLPIVEPVFDRVIGRRIVAHTSVVTITEVLVGPLRQDREDVATRYREILSSSIAVHPVTSQLADEAATLRAKYGLRTPDAIICATALRIGCDYVVTNDEDFKDVEGIRALVIKDYLREETR